MSSHDATIERLKEKAAAQEEEVQEEIEEVEPEESEAELPEKASSTREYVVLRKWEEAAVIMASSAEAALKILGKDDGDYAVIPSRNFSKFSIKTETTTVTHVKPA